MNDVCLEKIYIDEEYSSVNFARRGFSELMQDIGKQRINLIVVKDFSRFGRVKKDGVYMSEGMWFTVIKK